ncbi:hypothetical protein ABIA32_003314 [Streptacidiphilus sp. MAP12-20]|uniref:hypothetical protein n=1 Tax=Streptacidiphilus sp. MAP12-20 TaxID=3156299 RepID=UPI003511A3E2
MTETTLAHDPTGRRGGPHRQVDIQAKVKSEALVQGRAHCLSATITDFVRIQGHLVDLGSGIWFCVDGDELIAGLDAAAESMALADTGVRRTRNHTK